MYLKLTAKSDSLMRAVDIHVLLPYHDGYEGPKPPYRTVYFLPGYSANAEEILFSLPMRQMSALTGLAVVIPDGENSFYTDHPERLTCHGVFAGQELPAITRKMLPCLSAKREDTYLAGISMGGYGAMMLALRFPELYSRVALLSPAVEPEDLFAVKAGSSDPAMAPLMDSLMGGMQRYTDDPVLNLRRAVEQAAAGGRGVPPLWMCCGTEDALVGAACNRFSAFLRDNNIPHSYVQGRGEHDLLYWDEHLEEAFRFLSGQVS